MDIGAGEGLSARWAGIGAGASVALLAVQLWMIELPFHGTVVTAKGVHRRRPLVMVQVVGHHGKAPVEGWGECAALADTAYDTEDVNRSFGLLQHALVPALIDLAPRAGMRLPRPSELDVIRPAAPDAPLAFAALEMAVADAHLRAEGRSLADVLGVSGRTVPIGAVLGRPSSVEALVSEVAGLVASGISRVKLKIGPGWDLVPVEAVRSAFPTLLLQVDANGSYRETDADRLAGLDRFELLCIEQPFDRDDLAGHARLGTRLTTPICLDESLDSPRATRHALSLGACSVVCVKPARLGGLGAALDVVESCTEARVPLWIGGMYESGYGRGVNATVGALPGFSWPGDLRPASAYLDLDLVPPPARGRDGPTAPLHISLPAGPGMGVPPEQAVLENSATRRFWHELPRR
jgi:O-succinylbenzoate synthase